MDKRGRTSEEVLYNYTRVIGNILFGLVTVSVIIISIWGFGGIFKDITQSFAVNTFLVSYRKGPASYTWKHWDVFGNKEPLFFRCAEQTKLFDPVCVDSNLTAYTECVKNNFPEFSYNDKKSDGMYHLDSFSALKDISSFQFDLMAKCFADQQQPLMTILQDADSKHYLGSFNSFMLLFTALYVTMLFLAYTFFFDDNADRGGKSFNISRQKYYGRRDDGNGGWIRAGFWSTFFAFVMGCLLCIPLAVMTWRTQNTVAAFYDDRIPLTKRPVALELFDTRLPMTTQTASLSFFVMLVVTYYFGLELWKKYDLSMDTPSSEASASLVYANDMENRKQPPKNMSVKLFHYQEKNTNNLNETSLEPVLVFPWHVSYIFVDGLVFIGLLGLQLDNNTYEITEIFQCVTYAAVIGLVHAYDYYEKWDQKNMVMENKYWVMSFFSNVSALLFSVIPLILVLHRFTFQTSDTICNMIIAYVIFYFLIFAIRCVYQLVNPNPVFLGWAQLYWCFKVFKYLLFVLMIFFTATDKFKENTNLTKNLNTWLINSLYS